MVDISFITTGGTIDKVYFDQSSKYQVGPPFVETLLSELKVTFSYGIHTVFRKDSLDLTEEDREKIFYAVKDNPSQNIIITHGTDTMVETAAHLDTIANKTIVLTGSLQPALFKNSDALFNIGCAIGSVQTLPAGVYIVMHGKVYDAKTVIKNCLTNRFEHKEL